METFDEFKKLLTDPNEELINKLDLLNTDLDFELTDEQFEEIKQLIINKDI